jgi:hypothetical protein
MICVRPRLVTSNWDASWRNKTGEPHAVSNIRHHNRLASASSWGGGASARCSTHDTEGASAMQHTTRRGRGSARCSTHDTVPPRQPLTHTHQGEHPFFCPCPSPRCPPPTKWWSRMPKHVRVGFQDRAAQREGAHKALEQTLRSSASFPDAYLHQILRLNKANLALGGTGGSLLQALRQGQPSGPELRLSPFLSFSTPRPCPSNPPVCSLRFSQDP